MEKHARRLSFLSNHLNNATLHSSSHGATVVVAEKSSIQNTCSPEYSVESATLDAERNKIEFNVRQLTFLLDGGEDLTEV